MNKTGTYIHIPFCKSRCSYCDFATDVYKSDEGVELYVSALEKEISRFSNSLDSKTKANTIYFGGGTPSLLTASQLERILDAIHSKFEIEESAEITLEMNPATVSLEKLQDYKSMGVSRASFGVQTFDDRSLKLLARGHDANDARKTFELLRKVGFDNISFDLIAGLPHQTLKGWEKNLDEALKLEPEHLSLYLLEIHEGTPLAEQIKSKRQPMPNEDLAAEMYELMVERVGAKGFAQYEISNFSKPGFESRHNNKYWLCDPVYGFGVSAHSFDGIDTRWSNERDAKKYVELIACADTPIVETNQLETKQLSGEFAFLNLRLTKGLNLGDFRKRFNYDLAEEFKSEFESFEKLGLVQISENVLRLTPKGFVYSNEIFDLFV